MDEIETGNFNEEPSQRGWRVGHFIKDRPGFNTDLTELQWRFDIKAGSTKSAPAYNKQAATLTILVEGEMTIIFPHENRSIVLKEEGDYAFFAPGVCHTWEVSKDSKMVGMRWPSVKDDQVECDH